MFLDKNFKYILQNESTYFTFNLHNDLYNLNQLLQQLDCNILYDKENNIYKSITRKGRFRITYEPQMINFLFPDKKQFQLKYNKDLTEELLEQFK